MMVYCYCNEKLQNDTSNMATHRALGYSGMKFSPVDNKLTHSFVCYVMFRSSPSAHTVVGFLLQNMQTILCDTSSGIRMQLLLIEFAIVLTAILSNMWRPNTAFAQESYVRHV